jgi:hypothetical protein
MSRSHLRPSPNPFTRASAAILRGERRRPPAWWEIAPAWALLVAAGLLVPQPGRLHAAVHVVAVAWAGRLTLFRSRLAVLHAVLLVLCVVVIDVATAMLAGR